jgi:hypothetical protein
MTSGPEWDANVLQIFIGPMREFGSLNLILSKNLGVLPQTELLNPVRDLQHAATASRDW